MPLDGTGLDETTKIILDALDILRRDGWCRGRLIDGEGRVCANGALVKALGGKFVASIPLDYDMNKARAAVARLADAASVHFFAVPAHNNSRESFDEIEEWFLKAAATVNAC